MRNHPTNILLLLISALLFSSFSSVSPDVIAENNFDYPQSKSYSKKSDSIYQILRNIVIEGSAPGMIAAIVSADSVIAIASAGERKEGSGVPFSTNDKIHLGSCTKAMTSTMIATFVAEGKLSWDTKLIEAIPELVNKIHTDYYNITLWQLLTHRAGLPKNATDWYAWEEKEIKERRLAILVDNLRSPASHEMDKFHYSNLGYMIAACMVERISGKSWELLMKKRLFDPLGMPSAGTGAPNTHNETDQPWGHSKSWYGNKWTPDQSDNSVALGPAGTVHCSVEDWAKFISLQLSEENAILEKKYLNKLIEPVGNHYYAGGWGVAEQPWANGIMITHSGSNGIWYASVVITPVMNRAFIVATNSCDFGTTEDICRDVINKLIIMELDLNLN